MHLPIADCAGLAELETSSLRVRPWHRPASPYDCVASRSLHGPVALLLGTALVGVAFGAVYPLLVLVVAEMFGTVMAP